MKSSDNATILIKWYVLQRQLIVSNFSFVNYITADYCMADTALADLWTIIAIFMVNATILILMISNKFYNDFKTGAVLKCSCTMTIVGLGIN